MGQKGRGNSRHLMFRTRKYSQRFPVPTRTRMSAAWLHFSHAMNVRIIATAKWQSRLAFHDAMLNVTPTVSDASGDIAGRQFVNPREDYEKRWMDFVSRVNPRGTRRDSNSRSEIEN